jgi:SMODS-associated and fused to various effectors sensor domain
MVRDFVKERLEIGTLLLVSLSGGASGASVKSGSHAMKIAEEVVAFVRRAKQQASMLHFFIAAPNGFTFFLGQHQQAMGPSNVYEWDFEGSRSGS